jgi:hypothetical protein
MHGMTRLKCTPALWQDRAMPLPRTAASLRVKDVRCWYARRFIRETDGHPGDTHRGFSCRSWDGPDDGLAHTIHRCARGAKVIRWKRF